MLFYLLNTHFPIPNTVLKLDAFTKYCLSKPAVTKDFPFGEETICFRVAGKIFAITSFSIPLKVNLKCDPEEAVDLRERYEEVQPGYHMNKKHWNTVDFEGRISDAELKKMTDNSYDLIVSSLTKKQRELLSD